MGTETSKYAGHTPGPWHQNGNTAWADSCKDRGSVFECCLCVGTKVHTNQNQINARLIADAPLLLEQRDRLAEALRECAEGVERDLRLSEERAHPICRTTLANRAASLRAALTTID